MLHFDQNHRFVDGIFLLKLTTPTCPSLISMTKGIENLAEDIKALEFCTPTSGSEFKNSCTFVANNGDIFYYTLYFHQLQGCFELVIKSYQRCVYFFLNFLKDLFSAFYDVTSAYDPINVFNLASSLISHWPAKPVNEMDIVYSKSLITVYFSNADFAYNHYRPSYFLQPKMFSKIFDHLISMKPILLVSPDSIIGCKSCFSTFCLLYPLRYCEPFILWLRKDDPRYTEILNAEGKSPYLVVATDEPGQIVSKFDLVVQCSEMYRINVKADTCFQETVHRVLLVVQQELSNLLNKNPYSDILNIPWATKNIEDVLNSGKFPFMPTMENLRKFEKSQTVKNWRMRRGNVMSIRDNLLQCGEVKFGDMTKEQLKIVLDFLNSIRGLYEDDIHLNAVIRKHLAALNTLLSNCNVQNI